MSGLLPTFRSQRRFSFVLAAALCLWMLAVASHFHAGDYGKDSHSGSHSLCAFCASVPSSGAPAAIASFSAPHQPDIYLPSIDTGPAIAATADSRYYSRGPPLV